MRPVLQRDYDPSEPRDETGKWTSGGSGSGSSAASPTAFISPNVSTLTFDQAVQALDGERQKQVLAASQEIDKGLGITSANYPAIGAWSDGAENSLMVVAPGASAAQIRVASAMKGYIADQKAVLTFMPDATGSDFLASFPVQGNISEIHDQLLKAGLTFHTLQPHGDHVIVHAYGSDQDAIDAVHKAASGFGADPEFISGGGEFIGTTKTDGTDREQRDDARREYEKVIQAGLSSELEGQDFGALWHGIRDRWSAGPAGDSAGQKADSAGREGDRRRDVTVAFKPFARMTIAQASRTLPPALFRKYYVAACEFFDANEHVSRDLINDLVVIVRASPLYVRRDLRNIDEFTAWATAQGFDEVNDDLHVTVLYSKTPVDWDDMGNRDTDVLVVPAGGERSIEVLGDEGAVALVFASTVLARRHGEMIGDGASSDYDAYVPHVTINTSGTIPDGAVAYDGELIFGPEIFETITVEKEFDESKHPRNPKGTPEGGKFTTSGETSPEGTSEKFDPKVIEVGGDEWNRATARKLEREYQAAKPALDKIKNNAVKDSAGQSGWASLSESNKNTAFNEWRKENKIDDYDDAKEKWDKLGDEEKTKIAVDHGVVAAEQVLEAYATGAADWESLSDEQKETAKLQWIAANKDDFSEADDPAAVAEDYWKGMSEKDKFAYALTGEEPDDEDEDATFTPEEWGELSGDAQEHVFDAWKSQNQSSFYDSELESWGEEQAPDEARTKVAEDYNDGSEDEWARDTLKQLREDRAEQDAPEIPFSDDQLIQAIKLNYDNPGYGGGSYWKKWAKDVVSIGDGKLHELKAKEVGEDQGQGTFEGIEPPDYSKLLTSEMREDITRAMIDGLDDEGDRIIDKIEAPDYLNDSVNEQLDEYWDQMDDKAKFDFAKNNTEEIENASTGTDKQSSDPKSGTDTDSYRVTALPNTYDPLNETSGEDYVRTQRLARYMSITRAVELIKQRGIPVGYEPDVLAKQPKLLNDAMKAIDRRLWEDWKSSSTSQNGMLLQVATAEELGGRLNPKTSTGIDVDEVKRTADDNYRMTGGYNGVLAYVRAKWETTQYLLDKAEQNELQLFRGIDLKRYDPARYSQAVKEKGEKQLVPYEGHGGSKVTYEKLPTAKIDRNGAASATTDIGVANRWRRGEGAVVLRAYVPRTAAISIPAYGVNIQSEHEVVVAGTAWKSWDAWLGSAPEFWAVPMGAHGTGIGTSASVQQAA